MVLTRETRARVITLARNQCCSLLGALELRAGVSPANGGSRRRDDEEVDLSRVGTIS